MGFQKLFDLDGPPDVCRVGDPTLAIPQLEAEGLEGGFGKGAAEPPLQGLQVGTWSREHFHRPNGEGCCPRTTTGASDRRARGRPSPPWRAPPASRGQPRSHCPTGEGWCPRTTTGSVQGEQLRPSPPRGAPPTSPARRRRKRCSRSRKKASQSPNARSDRAPPRAVSSSAYSLARSAHSTADSAAVPPGASWRAVRFCAEAGFLVGGWVARSIVTSTFPAWSASPTG